MWEMIYLINEILPEVDNILKLKTSAPHLCAYVERFRDYPAFKPHPNLLWYRRMVLGLPGTPLDRWL